jgi:hypothetical protein
LVQLAKADPAVQDRLNQTDRQILMQATEGKPSVVHVMIDAGTAKKEFYAPAESYRSNRFSRILDCLLWRSVRRRAADI